MKPAAGRFFPRASGLAFLMSILAAAAAFGQAGSLYGASVEESAILVRVLNAGAPGPVSLKVGAQTLVARETGEASPYKPIAADIYMLPYGGKLVEFLPETSSYYTIVALPAGLVILKDTRHGDAAKAQLYFYNLGAGKAELRVADGSLVVIPAVESGASAQVAINAVSVSVAAFRAGKKAGNDLALRMARGSSYAVVLVDLSGSPRAFLVEAVVARD